MSVFKRLSFQLKLLLSFVLVIVLTTVAGYYLINRAVDRAFADFAARSFSRQDLIFQQILGNYYARFGSWNGVELIFARARELLPFVLVDADGRVLINPKRERIGEKVPRDDLKHGGAIVVGGETGGNDPPTATDHALQGVDRAGVPAHGQLSTLDRRRRGRSDRYSLERAVVAPIDRPAEEARYSGAADRLR